jgi:tyrosyl-tRNA synthetase
MTSSRDLSWLERTGDRVFSREELERKLSRGRPLRIKYGVDVTAPFLHIGHAVNLWMMRRLQEEGHRVQFLIGDFTTRIGDPTGRSAARAVPSREDIEANAQEFIRQVARVLHTDPAVFEVRRNSEWYDAMSVDQFLSLVGMVTHSRLVQRDMFQRRIENGDEIYMHEMLYPILQGYDSKMLDSDMTIVGSDQLFNELMGRTYQEKAGQEPQVVITTRITPGTDGVAKQSKSLGNYIALADTPRDMFGKAMSIPDHLTQSYLEVYTDVPLPAIATLGGPYAAKKRLAAELVRRYHGDEVAAAELAFWDETFAERKTPRNLPEVDASQHASLLDLIQACVPDRTRSEIRRLASEGAIALDDQRVEPGALVGAARGGGILRVGKRHWFRLVAL